MQEYEKKVSVTGGNPISVITQIPMMEHVNKDLVAIASAGSIFGMSTEDNVKNLCTN
jgi:hypothetical protein